MINETIKIRIQDLTQQFLQSLGEKLSGATEVEIRIPKKQQKEMFSEVLRLSLPF